MDKLCRDKAMLCIFSVFYAVLLIFDHLLYVGMVASDSMNPTLMKGNVIIALRGKTVDYGDIVIFKEEGRYKVKRLIGKAGDRLCYCEHSFYRNGRLLKEDYVVNAAVEINRSFEVPKECMMLLGDDRLKSIDIRKTGRYTPYEALVGKVIVIF